jgi:hypothetical protein
MLSIFLDVSRIILSRSEKCRTFHTFYQIRLALSKHSTNSKRRMEAKKGPESFILGSKLESSPNSPTKSSTKEIFNTFVM